MRFVTPFKTILFTAAVLAVVGLPCHAAAEITPEVRETLAQLERFSDAFAAVATEVQPAVVTVTSEKVVRAGNPSAGSPFEDPFFRRFFQPRGPQQERRQQGIGSGVIVSGDGYILTNNHVVDGAESIRVELSDKRKYDAEVVGTDPKSDLAVLKIDDGDLPTLAFGDSDEIKVGQWVLAVGNPFGLQHTVTYGIVSAKGRGNQGLAEYADFIQTDAAINPGNSGGAMVNLRGELIGINTAIASNTGAFVGYGFAIPINMARGIMSQLIETGQVRRGLLGVSIQIIGEDLAEGFGVEAHRGVIVTDVQEGGAAEKAGVKRDDVILKVDDYEVVDAVGMKNRIAQTPPGTTVELTVLRDGRKRTIKAKLGEREPTTEAHSPASRQHEKLGWEVQELTDEVAEQLGFEGRQGVVITGVQRGGIGERKGLQRGDLIIEVNRRPVESMRDYLTAVEKVEPGGVLLLVVRRSTQTFFVAIRVPK